MTIIPDIRVVSPTCEEMRFTDADFQRVAAIVREDAGISLSESKKPLVYSRLAKRLRALKFATFRQYCLYVASEEGADERKELLEAITTNVTHFFREPHHFQNLKTHILPPLLERARQGRSVRLWSAGCSTGQEPYSLAMLILSMEPRAAAFNIKMLATDVNEKVLAAARHGVYPAVALKNVDAALSSRFFTRTQDRDEPKVRVNDDVRALISFKQLNLMQPFPVRGPFDIIFCRNVVIYFDKSDAEELWEKFVSTLAPQGYLFIGHSERLSGAASDKMTTAGVTTYRKSQ